MTPYLQIAAVVSLLGWHLWWARAGLADIRNGRLPNPLAMAIASFIAYYDIGLFLEAVGVRYQAPGFSAFQLATPTTQTIVYLILFAVPPLLALGAHIWQPAQIEPQEPKPLTATLRIRFLLAFVLISAPIVILSCLAIYYGGGVAGGRLVTSRWLGPGAVILYIPLGMSFFLSATDRRRGYKSWLLAIFVATIAAVAIACLGQRTLVILPFAGVLLSRIRISVRALLVLGVLALLAATMMPILFKPAQRIAVPDRPSVIATINESLSRAPVLAEVTRRTEVVGTEIMQYPGQGYVYAALLFVPRAFAPFKANSTAQSFTDALEGKERFGRWAYGIGIVEESLLNVGYAATPFIVVIFGWVLGRLNNLVRRRPEVLVPVTFGAFWIGGYHLTALLITYTLVAVLAVFTSWYVYTKRLRWISSFSSWLTGHQDAPRGRHARD